MTPMLAPLVGDAPTVTFIGLCKNAGKTTAMCRLIEELSGETLAMTSVGRDGERTDVVTALKSRRSGSVPGPCSPPPGECSPCATPPCGWRGSPT